MPLSSSVESTSSVINVFPKKEKSKEEMEEQDEELEQDDIPESQMNTVQKVRKELSQMFSKNKDPDPLFKLDLILRPN